MAVTIGKITNIGFHVGNITIPCIKVVITERNNGEITQAILQNILESIQGCTSAVGYFTTDQNAYPQGISQGTTTYGSGGDKLVYEYHEVTSGSNFCYSEMVAYKGGSIIGAGSPSTGYSVYEYSPLTIFVTPDNQVYGITNYATPKIGSYRSDENMGIGLRYQVTVATLEGTPHATNSTYTLSLEPVADISGDIEREESPPGPDNDPYNGPGEGGDFDDGNSDNIGTPSLPSASASDTGFITLYNPSASQLKQLANYMWSDLFSLDTFKKLFADPMSAILGLSILPISIGTSGNREVKIGNISTGVSLPLVSHQFISVNCGSVKIKRQSPGTYLDFSPYTKVDLYLPFIGTHPLDVDEVMDKTINVTYHVDILSGACTAFVKVGDSVMYQFVGACAISVPITGNDWTRAINGALSIAGSIGSMVLTGGATAPMAAGTIASATVNSLKPSVEKSGAIGGAGGLMGVKRPYLIISRPNRNVAANQNEYIGYPSFKTLLMDDLKGFNSIYDTHLEGIPATQQEIDEIRALLKKGVIF